MMDKESLDKLVDSFLPFITGPDAANPEFFIRRLAEEVERETRHRAVRMAYRLATRLDDVREDDR